VKEGFWEEEEDEEESEEFWRGGGVWTNWRTSGRRVTIPEPRGRKSLPTILRISMKGEESVGPFHDEQEKEMRFELTFRVLMIYRHFAIHYYTYNTH